MYKVKLHRKYVVIYSTFYLCIETSHLFQPIISAKAIVHHINYCKTKVCAYLSNAVRVMHVYLCKRMLDNSARLLVIID